MTLIELLVVVTISAILLAVGVPMFNSTIAGSKTASAASDIRGSLELARSEAIRRGITVSICRVTAPNAVPPVCTNGGAGIFNAGDWASGWVVFVEDGGGAVGTADPLDTVLRRQNSATPGSPAVITGNAPVVSFGADGLRVNSPGIVTAFNVSSSDPNSPRRRYVCVGVTGQIYGQTGVCT